MTSTMINIKDNEYLEIDVSQQSGGMNYFNGKTERRGVYVTFIKTTYIKSDNGYSTKQFMPMDNNNFKILAIKNMRKSKKQLDLVNSIVHNNKDKLYQLWQDKNIGGITDILRTANV